MEREARTLARELRFVDLSGKVPFRSMYSGSLKKVIHFHPLSSPRVPYFPPLASLFLIYPLLIYMILIRINSIL